MRESWQRGSQKYKHQNSSDVSPLISTEGKEGLSEQHHGWTERKNTETALAYVIAIMIQSKTMNSVTKAVLKAEHSLQVRLVAQSYTNTDGQVPKSY